MDFGLWGGGRKANRNIHKTIKRDKCKNISIQKEKRGRRGEGVDGYNELNVTCLRIIILELKWGLRYSTLQSKTNCRTFMYRSIEQL